MPSKKSVSLLAQLLTAISNLGQKKKGMLPGIDFSHGIILILSDCSKKLTGYGFLATMVQ